MADLTTILAPIRYPLTDESAQTLATAGRLAHDHTPVDLTVLHVNLYQNGDDTHPRELTQAISSRLNDIEASVTTREGFLVEEVILEGATQIDADIVVVGANQQAAWRQILRRILQNGPAVGGYLRKNVTDDTEIWEVDPTAESPIVEPV